MLRVTPDTQVLIQAAISHKGAAGQILAAWAAGEVEILTCDQILAEYRETLRSPHIRDRYAHVTGAAIAAAAAALREYSTIVTVADIPQVVREDPDDDGVLACAVAGGADYVISRDHHLRQLGVYQGIPIVTAESFLPILRGRVREERAVFSGAAP